MGLAGFGGNENGVTSHDERMDEWMDGVGEDSVDLIGGDLYSVY